MTRRKRRPLCIDLYCGLGGWAEGFLREGYQVIGFDIEKHDYGTGAYPGELVLQDVLTLTGAQLAAADVIVASPPCTEPSYRAMPWGRAKWLNRKGPPHTFIKLFEACFRLQRELWEASGRYVPLVVENVRGAQPWIGRAKNHYGSFYLWGDVPERLPEAPFQTAATKTVGYPNIRNGHSHTRHFTNPAEHGRKVPGLDWSAYGQPGYKSRGFNVTAAQRYRAGIKDFCPTGQPLGKNVLARFGSKSDSRKAASAEIAKIPFPLSLFIAQYYKPVDACELL